MSKQFVLEAEIREQAGSKAAAKLRQRGRIPAIVYGHKQEALSISLDAHDFVEGLHHGQRLADVGIAGQRQKVLIKEVQYDPLGRDVIHADLMRVDVTERIKVTVPIELKGTAKGAHEGGVVTEHADRLEIECLATDIPATVVVWIKDLGVGDSIHAKDVQLPEGIKLVSGPETLLLSCQLVAAAKAEEAVVVEEPTAPEVISQAKETGEETEEEKEKK